MVVSICDPLGLKSVIDCFPKILEKPGSPEVHIDESLNNFVSEKGETKLCSSHLSGNTPFPKSSQPFFPGCNNVQTLLIKIVTTCKSFQLCQQFQSSWSGLALLVPAQLVTSRNLNHFLTWMNVPNRHLQSSLDHVKWSHKGGGDGASKWASKKYGEGSVVACVVC